MNQINNDDIHQGPKPISSDKDIYSSLGVAKVGPPSKHVYPFSKAIVVIVSWSVSWTTMYIHSYKDIETNGYINCQSYDHIDIVKDGQP